MTNLHKVLVPVDFSEPSAGAARYAAAICAPGGCEVHLLHVVPPRSYGYAMIEPDESRRREESVDRIEDALEGLSKLDGGFGKDVEVLLKAAEGEAAPEIVRYANEQNVDAVVMPTRGRDRFERLLLIGSVTMKVLHALERPVITGVRFEDHLPPKAIRRVLCAVDLGPSSERVLCAALQAARGFNAQLAIVHAVPVFGHADTEIYEDSWRDTVTDRVRRKLGALAAKLGAEADLHVETDQPPRAISSLALKLGADLVVLGRGASDGLIGRLRSDAYDIIRLCHCPVVSV
jgi:nucleotide-binding universal stress UspA family protein